MRIRARFWRLPDPDLIVVYDGPAVAEGSMDVQDLAPALLGLGDLLQAANTALNGDRAKLSVRVRSDFESGSFDVSIDLVQTLAQQAKGLLFAAQVAGVMDLLQVLGFVGLDAKGVFQALRFLKGKPPSEVRPLQDGRIELHNVENSTIIINQNVGAVLDQPRVRAAVPKVVAPLKRDGIEKIAVHAPNEEAALSVSRTEVDYFVDPLGGEGIEVLLPLGEDEREAVLSIVRVVFDGDAKWVLSDGDNNFNVVIADEEFLARVKGDEIRFAAHDVLRVKLKTSARRTATGRLATDYTVTKVVDVVPAEHPKQLSFADLPPDPK